jgi:glycosyltransferase involved in cell wall biosynthesis
MSTDTRISVIIPVHNGERFLSHAIQSVLDQRIASCEIIVVDDGSTDNSKVVAQRYPGAVTYHYQPHAGVAAARNAGLARARNAIVGFLDQDDRWAPDKLAVMLPVFATDRTLDAIYGLTIQTVLRPDPTGKMVEIEGDPHFNWVVGSALFRRRVFERVGNFDETVRYYTDDTDFFLRLRESGLRIHYTEQVALYYRLHGDNTSLKMHTARRMFFVEALKRSLDRRRRANQITLSPLPEFARPSTKGKE